MEFARYEDFYTVNRRALERDDPRRKLPPEPFYRNVLFKHPMAKGNNVQAICEVEIEWWRRRRPYYNLYPAIWRALDDYQPDVINSDPLFGELGPVAVSCPLWDNPLMIYAGKGVFGEQMVLVSESTHRENGAFYTTIFVPSTARGKFLSDYLETPLDVKDYSTSKEGFKGGRDGSVNHMRVLCLVSMLAQCNDLFEPHVLTDDQAKWERAPTEEERKRIADRATNRRQQVGHTIGRAFEKQTNDPGAPHLRLPHPCLYHVGQGRAAQIIKMRRGCLVNPRAVHTVPTGYLGGTSNEVEKT